MPKIGAHVSAAVELSRSVAKAQEIGAECTQIFISPPQQWFQNKHSDQEINDYRLKIKEAGIGPNFIHGTYLINLASTNPVHVQKSIDWLIYALNMAVKLGVQGVIFHPGSHKGAGFETVEKQIVQSLVEILNRVKDDNIQLILENSAGAGGAVGSSFSEFGKILKTVNDPRLKVCLDTQHAFAAGYDVKTLVGLQDVLEEFDQEIGLQNLVAIHANDSKTEYKSNRDRHENIGEGLIGMEGFENMVNHPKLSNIPFILEVPGFADNGPDKENVTLFKSLIQAK